MSRPVFIEAALNGPWSQNRQPLMPVTTNDLIAEGINCAKAGASIIHLHVYDPETGQQFEDFDAYRAVIEGIRQYQDVIVYPTLPLSGFGNTNQNFKPDARFSTVKKLAKSGLIEWSVIDPGTTQITELDTTNDDGVQFLYINSEPEIRYGLKLASQYNFVPSFAIYEPGFLRLGGMLSKKIKGCPKPIYRFMFSDRFSFGFPAEEIYLSAYIKLLKQTDPNALWMIAGLQVNTQNIISSCLAAGGHIRTGLEDAHFQSELGNLQLVRQVAQNIHHEGYEIGTAAQLRKSLQSL
jgi:uncharacterized protein (DUF849 family)